MEIHHIARIICLARGVLAVSLVAASLTTATVADQAYDRCMESSDATNAAWSICGGEYLSRLDDQLNSAWKATFPLLSKEGQAKLRAEQRAWNEFKEVSCLYYVGDDYGREGQVLDMPICRGAIIEQRIDYLNGLLENMEPS